MYGNPARRHIGRGPKQKKTGPHQREDRRARNGVAQDNGGAVAVCACSAVSGPLLALSLRNWANSCVAAADLTDARPKKRLAQAGPGCRSEKTQAGPNLGRATRLFWQESVRAQIGRWGRSGRSKTGGLKSRRERRRRSGFRVRMGVGFRARGMGGLL